MSRIDIRIDELVLEGVPAHEAPAAAEALRVELQRLLAADLSLGADPVGLLAASRLAVGPAGIAAAAARAVHAAVRAAIPGAAAPTGGVEDAAAPASPRPVVGAGARDTRPDSRGVTAGNPIGGVA